MEWHVRVDHETFVARSDAELIQWLTEGRITAETPTWRSGYTRWVPLGTIPELERYRTGVTPLPAQLRAARPPAGFRLLALVISGGIVVLVLPWMCHRPPGDAAAPSTAYRPPAVQQTPPTSVSTRPSTVPSFPRQSSDVLHVTGLRTIPVARTTEAFERFLKASARNDRHEHGLLFLSGELVLVDNGTRVLVLERGFGKHRVRVLEGDEEGFSGWVPREWVKSR
jgi:hypothetical protein